MAKQLADVGKQWSRAAAKRMPEASGDIREIVNEPFFVPLFSLFRAYGTVFKLCLGPQTFVVISDPALAKQVRWFPFSALVHPDSSPVASLWHHRFCGHLRPGACEAGALVSPALCSSCSSKVISCSEPMAPSFVW